MNSLPWPKILVFHHKGGGRDLFQEAESLRKRSFNVSILYPPSLVNEFSVISAEWTPSVNLAGGNECCVVTHCIVLYCIMLQ